MIPLISALVLFQLAPGAAVPDQVSLKNGSTVTGRVVTEDVDTLRVRTGRGDTAIERSDVADVRSLESSLKEALDHWDVIRKHDDPDALGDLARFCAARGLTGEAQNLWIRILTLDPAATQPRGELSPSGEGAARAIGARKIDGVWNIEVSQRWIKLRDFLGPKDHWRNAITLKTGHFLVKTDLPLADVLGVTVGLEREYLRVYGTIGAPLGLWSFGEVPVVNVYTHDADYPSPPILGDNSFFEPTNNQMHVLRTEALDMQRITRDVTEMVLFNALRRSSGRNGEMMGWAQRGIEQYFAASHPSTLSGPGEELGVPSYPMFAEQLIDKKPLTLTRLLNTSISEFRSGPDGERRAERAYTFVHFLVRGDGGAHREDFLHYLRDARLGRGGRTLLYRDLHLQPADLEKRWNEYVASVVRSQVPSTSGASP